MTLKFLDPTWRISLTVCFVLAACIFTLWPQIDLTVSGWFYTEDQKFWLKDNLFIATLRHACYYLMTGVFFVVALMSIASLFGFKLLDVPARLWHFSTALYIAGPMVLANLILKEEWGRARPAHIVEFGGQSAFTPALRWTDECARNCSFVSGEGSGATAMAIVMIVLAPFVLAKFKARHRQNILYGALAIPAIAIVLRVVTGRHFLSDTVFAILMVLIVATLLYPLIVGSVSQGRNKGH